MRFDSSRLVAGGAVAPIVKDPSLNGGMNSPPMKATAATARVASTAVTARTTFACRNVRCRIRSSTRFSQASRNGSCACSKNFARGSKYEASTGVTVNDTASDANSVTRYDKPKGANIRPSSPPNENSGSTTSTTISVA